MTVDLEALAEHYSIAVRGLRNGWVVPVLGAGANRAGRPKGQDWSFGSPYLPDGGELAEYLADEFDDYDGDPRDLIRISQYVAVVGGGTGPLYKTLHPVFDRDYAITPLHEFLAHLPGALREAGKLRSYPLVLTTNYDDLLERAFERAGESFDVVWYIADGEARGKFWRRPPDGEPRQIDQPEEYDGLDLEQRPVILKIHGAVDRLARERDSYVITENNYIDYLSQGDIAGQIPMTLRERMADSHFLFLGYSMRDWNLRVILNRIWGAEELDLKSWAVQREPDDPIAKKIEETLWDDRGDVELLYVPLREYIERLSSEVLGASTGTAQQ